MASQARPADRPSQPQARPAGASRPVAFRPVALPALAAAMQAVRGGRPAAARPGR